MTDSIESQPFSEPTTRADTDTSSDTPTAEVAEVATVSEEVVDDTAITVDLEAIAIDLADVEVALARLDSGAYWTDEVTGEALPDELLERSPVARRLPGA